VEYKAIWNTRPNDDMSEQVHKKRTHMLGVAGEQLSLGRAR